MALNLTNTLTRKKEEFIPLEAGKVSIYCCGVTVYDLCHLGHARSYIAWDVLRRYLIWLGYQVTFVQNFTDIDDKILDKANQESVSIDQITTRNINAFFKDMDQLGIMRPDSMPRATNCLQPIIQLISELQSKGFAYSVDGDVYFSVLKYSSYGKLSGRDLESQVLNAEGRVTKKDANKKISPYDFALWKKAKSEETSYPSPWSNGRPGWHIECSAMVKEELGDSIDIHLGGSDLIFPHHENEIAQTECITGKEMARYWLHNGMVNVSGEKMSKSLGNFKTIRSLLDSGVSAMTIRLFVLQANYRKPIDFTEEAIRAATTAWKRINSALDLGNKYSKQLSPYRSIKANYDDLNKSTNRDNLLNPYQIQLLEGFVSYMNDDLNTSGALSIVFRLAKPLSAFYNQLETNSSLDLSDNELNEINSNWQLLVGICSVLGLKSEYNNNSSLDPHSLSESSIIELINKRNNAKAEKDYTLADKIRSDLLKKGIKLIDKPAGSTDWIRI